MEIGHGLWQGLGIGILGGGFEAQGPRDLEIGVWGSVSRAWVILGVRAQEWGSRVRDYGFRFQGLGLNTRLG